MIHEEVGEGDGAGLCGGLFVTKNSVTLVRNFIKISALIKSAKSYLGSGEGGSVFG